MKPLNLTACLAAAGLLLNAATLHAQDDAAEDAPDPRWTWDLTDLYQSSSDW